VDFDGAGNLLVAGQYTGTLDLGAGSIGPSGDGLFVAKLDPAGNTIWSKDLGGTLYVVVPMRAGGGGNLLVAGGYDPPYVGPGVDLGCGPIPAPTMAGNVRVFVGMLGGDGTCQWSVASAADGNARINALATDAGGRVYVTGWHLGQLDLGSPVSAAPGAWNLFVAAFDAAGHPQWTRSVASTVPPGLPGVYTAVQGTGLTSDPQGHVYVVGTYTGTVDFGDGVLPVVDPEMDASGMFVAKLDAAGNTLWSQGFTLTTPHAGVGFDPRVAASGDKVLVSGSYDGPISFGGGPPLPVPSNIMGNFLLQLDGSGHLIWSRGFSAITGSAFITPAFLGQDRIFIFGQLFGTVDLGQGPLDGAAASAGGSPLVGMLDSLGNTQWAKIIGGGGGSVVGRATCGELILSGNFTAPTDLGCGSLPFSKSSTLYLSRLAL
jgi:hypothetical protein